MPLPALSVGLVVRYDYLWHRQAEAGADNAEKDRPACVVLAFEDDQAGEMVFLLPITHSEPTGETEGIEIPSKVKAHLGLDGEKSWIIVTEFNLDSWPSPDLKQLPHKPGAFDYGHLPPKLYLNVRDAFMTAYKNKKAYQVKRDEDLPSPKP